MKEARLIKHGTQSKQPPKQVQAAQSMQTAIVRTAVKTVRAWVQEHQTVERLTPRQQFAALFS